MCTGTSLRVNIRRRTDTANLPGVPRAGSDQLCVGRRRVPCAPEPLAVGVFGLGVAGEGADRPAVDRLLLDAVRAVRGGESLGVTPSTSFFCGGLTTGHFLRQSPVYADFVGQAEVLREVVNRHASLVDDDVSEFRVLGDRKSGEVSRCGTRVPGRLFPSGAEANHLPPRPRPLTSAGPVSLAYRYMTTRHGQLPGPVGPGDLARQCGVGARGGRGVVGRHHRPGLRTVAPFRGPGYGRPSAP